jgi:hypothetical protein
MTKPSRKNKAPKASPAKTKIDLDVVRQEVLHTLRVKLNSAQGHVMGIDQAFDKSGVAFFFPSLPRDDLLDYFIGTFLCRIDPRFARRGAEMMAVIRSVIKSGGGALELPPRPPKRLPLGFGSILVAKKGISACFQGVVEFKPGDEPEWKQARDISVKLSEIASIFVKLAQASGDGSPAIAIEGMALRGSINTIAILPCLGILYGRVWETFQDNPITRGLMCELPIGRWKKLFTGSGRADKKMIKSTCIDLGFGRMETDDESDAIGLALTKALFADEDVAKDTGGRLRPTRLEREKQRAKKLSTARASAKSRR